MKNLKQIGLTFILVTIAAFAGMSLLAQENNKFVPSPELDAKVRKCIENQKPDGFHIPYEATGNEFHLKDNPVSPNLKINSSEEVHIVVEAINNSLSLYFIPTIGTSATEATIRIEGLTGVFPNMTSSSKIFRHQDGYFQDADSLDEHNVYTYTQDLKERHHVYFMLRHGTVNIGEEKNGIFPPAPLLYTYITATWTYTLSQHTLENVVVVADNITLTGGSYVISSSDYTYGVYLSGRSGVTISDCIINSFSRGIALYSCSSCTITNCTLSDQTYIGIYLYTGSGHTVSYCGLYDITSYGLVLSCSGSTIKYNTVNNVIDGNGIQGSDADNNSFIGNYCSDIDSGNGIALSYGSTGNTLNGNICSGNLINVQFGSSSNNNTLVNSTLTDGGYGIYLDYTNGHSIYHNNIYSNSTKNVYSDDSNEISYNSQGNWWGYYGCPGFTAGTDSNNSNVLDSYPYYIPDGWSLGYAPKMTDTNSAIAVTLSTPSNGEYIYDTTPTFTWQAVTDTETGTLDYQIQLGSNADFDSITDTNTVLLIHANGSLSSTIFTDSSIYSRTVTANGGAQIDTAQSKFSGASGWFDGSNDYLAIPDGADWDFGTGNFTIDFWVRFNSTSGIQQFIDQKVPSTAYSTYIAKESNNKLTMYFYDGSGIRGQYTMTNAWSVNNNQWYHLAFARNGSNALIFIDGVTQTLTTNTAWNGSLGSGTSALNIGGDVVNNRYWVNGRIDEIRISKGVARWISNFTPPAREYNGQPFVPITTLLLHANGTTFTDSSVYSRIVTAYGTAQISTSQSKFGGASGAFDGNGDYVTVPDSSDWDFGTSDFTIDFWVWFSDKTGEQVLLDQMYGPAYGMLIEKLASSHKLSMYFYKGSILGQYTMTNNWSVNNNQWYHLAFAKNGNSASNALIFIDGVAQTLTTNTAWNGSLGGGDSALYIGADGYNTRYYLNGYMDEVRISKGVARWISNFTPPSNEYSAQPLISVTGITTTSYTITPTLTENIYYWHVRSRDNANNYGDYSNSYSFIIDATAPVISNLTPAQSSIISTTDTPLISANYSDSVSGIKTSTAIMKLNDITVTANANSQSISYTPTSLSQGTTHYVDVSITDYAGNVATATWSFMVDTISPTGYVLINSGDWVTTDTNATLTLSGVDTGSGVSLMRMYNGATWTDWTNYATSYSNFYIGSTLGTKTVTVQYQDYAGNVSTGTISDTIVLAQDHNGDDWAFDENEEIYGIHYNIENFIIPEGITITTKSMEILEINAQNIIITGALSADGKGYAQTQGEGAGSNGSPYWNSYYEDYSYGGGGGGGYGGAGGQGAGDGGGAGGETYGDPLAPTEFGSGGGQGAGGTTGGAGGGVITLKAIDGITITGIVSANGTKGTDGYYDEYTEDCYGGAGGGAGGSIWLIANIIDGGSSIEANGGNGGDADEYYLCQTGAGAGGGRIKISCKYLYIILEHITANGGLKGTAHEGNPDAQDGEDGTIEILYPPDAPSDLTCTAFSSTEIYLSVTDTSTTEEYFTVERKIQYGTYEVIAYISGITPSESGYALNFLDDVVSSDTTYTYRIRAYNEAGYSDYSNELSVLTLMQSPSDLATTPVSLTEANLNWTDTTSSEEGCILERKTGYGDYESIATIYTGTTSYADAGLASDTRYYYRIKAYRTGNFGEYSDESNVVTYRLTVNYLSGMVTDYYNGGDITNYNVYEGLLDDLSSAQSYAEQGDLVQYVAKVNEFNDTVISETGTSISQSAGPVLSQSANIVKEIKAEIKGEDPHSPPVSYFPEGYPISVTATVSPSNTAGEYKWVITPSGTSKIEFPYPSQISGTLTADSPLTATTIAVKGLQPSSSITDTVGVMLVFTSTGGTVVSSTYYAPVVTTTFPSVVISSSNTEMIIVKEKEYVCDVVVTCNPFTITSTATINCFPAIDEYCAQWREGWIQNMITRTIIAYYNDAENTIKNVTLKSPHSYPLLDSRGIVSVGSLDKELLSFEVNNGGVIGLYRDAPTSVRSWYALFVPEPDIPELYKMEYYALFINWQVAYNEITGEIRYHHYIVWEMTFTVTFDGTKPRGERANNPIAGIVKKVTEGDGMGNWESLIEEYNLSKSPPVLTTPLANDENIWDGLK